MSIQDYPDLVYRGQMIDIARNYTTVDNLKKLIDVLSSYKLNVLHFHFSDDEGWRLEIPGLEERQQSVRDGDIPPMNRNGNTLPTTVDTTLFLLQRETAIIPVPNLLISCNMQRKGIYRSSLK